MVKNEGSTGFKELCSVSSGFTRHSYMQRLKTNITFPTLIALVMLMPGCSTVDTEVSVREPSTTSVSEKIDRLLSQAAKEVGAVATELKLQAAEIATDDGRFDTVRDILGSISDPFASDASTRDYSILRARLAIQEKQPEVALWLLNQQRFQRLPLDSRARTRAGRIRADAYLAEQNYLASTRELIYINKLLPAQARGDNQERIFATLLQLPYETLVKQAELSTISDIRGWLSLAAMTRRFQHDPDRQLEALNDWRQLWSNHAASIQLPRSLALLHQVVAEQPQHIALLLPLQGELGQFGRAIRDGLIAAHYSRGLGTALTIFDTTGSDIREVASRARAAGAELMIGPLDWQRVARLAKRRPDIPVIALNRTRNGAVQPNLYQFGLAPEDESIQVARQIHKEGHSRGLIIAPDTDWGQRNVAAFSGEFLALGGIIMDSVRFRDQKDYSDMIMTLLNVDASKARAKTMERITGEQFKFTLRRRQDIDFIFLLANPTQARGINPTLAFFYAEDIPVYATSHVYDPMDSRIDIIDMNGIRFCDIPWKLMLTGPVQELVQKTWPGASSRLAPFYALGLDVHRLYPRLRQLKASPLTQVSGTTGLLRLTEDGVIHRTLLWAEFREGSVRATPPNSASATSNTGALNTGDLNTGDLNTRVLQ